MKVRVLLALVVCMLVVTPLLADPPATSGLVMRGETVAGYYYTDDKRGYVVFYGWDLFAVCQGDPDFEISIWSFQVNDPPAEEIIHELLKGEVFTIVWGLEALSDPCSYWPLATGTSSVLVNFGGNGVANVSAHGTLTDPVDGETFLFTSNLHCVIDVFGTCVDNYHAKIVLH